jgi:AraC family transcriptional regulator
MISQLSRPGVAPGTRNIVWSPVSRLDYTLGVDASSRAIGNGTSLIVCLRGNVTLRSADGEWTLPAGHVEIVEGTVVVQSEADAAGTAWAMLSGSEAVWASALAATGTTLHRHVLPGRSAIAAEQRRQWLMLCIGANDPIARNASMIGLIAPMQSALHAEVERCPGRSLSRRRHVYSRLQRARNFLRARGPSGVGLDAAAAHIGYSPCHFLRVFHRVFGETPQTFIVDQRLELARRLLHSSSMGVIEVGFASGFDSRWSFARQFRRRFGVTASHFRRSQRESRNASHSGQILPNHAADSSFSKSTTGLC